MHPLKRLTVTLTICAIAVVFNAAKAEDEPGTAGVVHTLDGPIMGTTSSDGKIDIYRGIPYATPPVGDLRWKTPQSMKPWTTVYHADHFGASCMQDLQRSRPPWTKEFMAQNEESEDCLTLNVWTPVASANKKLPVLFWIHGGGYNEGSSEVPVYDGAELARTGMVVVTINYRLGIFGFLAHPELSDESPHHSSGNYGLLDQVAALEWVRKNIRAFGGNPDCVTIDGQSAGAGSVHALTASPLAKGLFQRGIAESGSGVTSFPMRSLADAEKNGVAFATRHGVQSIKELRAMKAEDLMPAPARGAPSGVPDFRFGPNIDGWFYPEDPDQIFAEGKQNDVPFLTGLQANDFMLMAPKTLDAEAFRKQVTQRYGSMAEDFLKLYPAGSNEEAAQSQIDSARDRGKVSMYVWVLQRAKTSKTPVYTYYFTRALPDPVHPEFGAFHTGEVPYRFRNLAIFDRPFTTVDSYVRDVISTYFKHFSETGIPDGAHLSSWSPATPNNPTTMQIGELSSQVPLASPEKLRFWISYFDSPLSKNAPMF